MSSLLSAAAPNPTEPQVNGAQVIHNDVNPPGAYCTYTSSKFSVMIPFVRVANLCVFQNAILLAVLM